MNDSPPWSTDTITDGLYRTQFLGFADIMAEWLGDLGGLAGKDILDFGCGEATTALGVALRYQPRRMLAVDISPKYDRCLPAAREQLGLERLPDNLEFATIAPDGAMDGLGEFDFIYSWSVFEHVSQEAVGSRLRLLRNALRPGGLIFLQVTPLYFSAEGSHMKPWLPTPWAHLLLQNNRFREQLMAAVTDGAEAAILWSVYETLNKITAPTMRREVEEAGFAILRDYRTKDELKVPPVLKEIYTEETLLTNQIVILAKTPEADVR